MALLPQSIQYIERLQQFPSYTTLQPQQIRALKYKEYKMLASPLLQSITDTRITVRDGAKITVRIYRPKTMKKLPVIVYYHGGGWVINDINTSHESCIELAHQTEHIVVSVDYRLAPEHKFPTPLHDAFDAFVWVKQHINKLHALDEVSVAGDSAGGNLAIGVSQLAAATPYDVKSQLLLYPVTQLSYDTPSYTTYGSGYGLDRDVMQWFGAHYIDDEEPAINPLVSPLLADVSTLPPAFIVAAQYDVLYDEIISFANKLKQYNDVTLVKAEGLVHSYFTNNDLFAADISATIQQMKQFLKKPELQSATA